jgi:hypothetical protein
MALKKKPAVKSRTWNKGLGAGQKGAFTPAQVETNSTRPRGPWGSGDQRSGSLLVGDRHHAAGAGTTQSDC